MYDTYEDGNWSSSYDTTQSLYPNPNVEKFNLNIPDLKDRQVGTFIFQPTGSLTTLYVAPQPVWSDIPVTANIIRNKDGTVDLGSLTAIRGIQSDENYTIKSALSTVTVQQLRDAGTNYPQWVKDRYLQLPSTITKRTKDLAKEKIGNFTDPYDMANAITIYLRTNIKYSQVISPPPNGQDPVDWFLFDYQQGFCNYYASAEVIMLRSLGIPARMAVGYAEGELQPAKKQENSGSANLNNGMDEYIIRQRDAHAWPEVYFPGIGWVEFEPTSSQAALQRPTGGTSDQQNPNQPAKPKPSSPSTAESTDSQGSAGILSPNSLKMVIIYLVAVLAIAILGVALFAYRKRMPKRPPQPPIAVRLERTMLRFGLRPPKFLQRWARFASLPVLSKAYLEINRALSRLGKPPAVQDTPAERGTQLVNMIPIVKGQAEYLVNEYQLSIYSPQPANGEAANQAGSFIRKESYLALLRRLFSRLQRST